MRIVLVCILFEILLVNTLRAQDDGVAYRLKLDEVSVVEKRPMKSIGLQLVRLDTLVLHTNIALSMADILLQHSTIFVKSYGRATESTAEFRGTSASHTQVTWNGMKINSPMLGMLDFSTVPSYFVDDVSLYYGASSVNLTGGGLGGAVELVTRPADREGLGLQYIQGIGSFDTYDQFLRLTYGRGLWKASTRVVYSRAKNDYKYTNYDKKVDVFDDQGHRMGSYHPEERNKSGDFKDFHVLQELYYRTLSGHRLGLAVWYSSLERGLPFLSVDYAEDMTFRNVQNANTLRAVLTWDWFLEHFKFSGKGGYVYTDGGHNYTKQQLGVKTDINNSHSYVNTAFGHFEAEYAPSSKWLFTGNIALYDNFVNSSDNSPFHVGDNYNKSRVELSAFLSAKWKPVDRLGISLCLREEMYKDYVVPVIPAGFIDFVISKRWNLVFKSSVARNYRYPSLDDLYFQPGGNPDLQPEYGFTYDGGLEFQVIQKKYKIKGNVTAFESHIKDWILWTPDFRGIWRPDNVKKVHSYGVEMMMNGEVQLADKTSFRADANFAWTPSLNLGARVNSNDASYGKQLCYIPEYSAGFTGHLNWRTWGILYKWCYYGERFTTTSNDVTLLTGRLKPYYMSDISLEKRFEHRWLDWSLKGVINNLFNSEYVTVLSRPMPRQNYEVFVELRPKFLARKSQE